MEVKDRKEELAQMLDYAKYYRQVTKSQLSTPRLSKKMSHICNIDTDVVNVFFMQFLKYADEMIFKRMKFIRLLTWLKIIWLAVSCAICRVTH